MWTPLGPIARTAKRSLQAIGQLLVAIFRIVGFTALVLVLVLGTLTLGGYPVVDHLDGEGPTGFSVDGEFPIGSTQTGPTVPPEADQRHPALAHPGDPGASAYDTTDETVRSTLVEDLVHQKINERRADRGIDPLEWDGTISSVSRAHSVDMADRGYFDHTNLDGEEPWDRFDRVADYCGMYGENIATNWVDRPVRDRSSHALEEHTTSEEIAEALVEQWMNSPPHRDNLLWEEWERAGVGIYVDDDGEIFATHNFCAT